MKITKVDIMQLQTRGSKTWRPIVLRIYTDEGLYGDGEAGMAFDTGAPGAFGMTRDMARLIIGMDPLENEVIWDKLYKQSFWGQNGGPVVFSALSAIDIALWDIKGKFFNVPVYKLLGGKRRESMRAYASQLQFGWHDSRVAAATEDYVKYADCAMAEGYDAVKYDFFMYDKDGRPFTQDERTGVLRTYYLDLIEERVSAVRQTVGKNVDIIIENHSYTDTLSAVQIGQRLEKYNIFYFEEPNTPTPKMSKYVCEKINIPVASGERIYSRWQYAPYFENNSLQIIQPDICNCGGITEVKKICDMAYIYDISVQPHVCGSPISSTAALHLESVIPNFIIHEHHRNHIEDFNKEFCIYDYQPVNGLIAVPERPGIGNELSEYAFKHCEKVTVE